MLKTVASLVLVGVVFAFPAMASTCYQPEPPKEEPEVPVVDEPETAPESPVTTPKSRRSGDGCERPSKPQGFRYQFVSGGNMLKWEKKGSWEKVDIAVYAMDKTTLLYYIRTADDGSHLMPTRTTWHKIRGVSKCGLGEWSQMIN